MVRYFCLIFIAIQATLVASSPFSGFYVGGGVGWDLFNLQDRTQNVTDTFRDQSRWDYAPRLGAGGQWSFCRCLTAGVEWIYNFPGNVHYPAPFFLGDENQHRVRVRGNQLAFTLNYYFY